jgi:lipopolysaccharide export system ATP-binding protein
MTTLAAKNLIKNYNKRNVVNGVSLQVNTGEVVGLLGLAKPQVFICW